MKFIKRRSLVGHVSVASLSIEVQAWYGLMGVLTKRLQVVSVEPTMRQTRVVIVIQGRIGVAVALQADVSLSALIRRVWIQFFCCFLPISNTILVVLTALAGSFCRLISTFSRIFGLTISRPSTNSLHLKPV